MLDRPKPLLLAEEKAAKPGQSEPARVVGAETEDERSGHGWAGRRRRLGLVAAAGLAVVALVYWVPRRVPDEELGSSEIVVEQPEPGTNGETGAVLIADGREDETGSAGEADPEADEARGETLVPDGGAAIEAALGLDRAARRAIQEGLAAAGFDPGVADGLFGAGTRDALRAWQADRGITETGYLTETSAAELRAAGEATVAVRRGDVPTDRVALAPPPSRPAGETRVFDGMEFVWVPAGEFQMGSTTSDAFENEQPMTRVRIGQGFWMGKHEVTQAEWQEVMDLNPTRFAICLQCPADYISWDDTQAFIARLNERGGGNWYRLPREAEWEYAARAGTSGDVYSDDLEAIAWCGDELEGRIHRVGQKASNAWGLHDMLGNVWEWVEDWYGDYPGGTATDPGGPASGSDERVYRGGAWYSDAWECRLPYRGSDEPDTSIANTLPPPPNPPPGIDIIFRVGSDLGFRLLRDVDAVDTLPAPPSPTGAIAGFVRDLVCSPILGTMIEVSGPALNGQVRAVYVYENGGYAVWALPSGTYAVTFRSPGFTSFRHESVEVTMGLTTTVNAELEIGISERLITVSGEIVAGRCQNEQ